MVTNVTNLLPPPHLTDDEEQLFNKKSKERKSWTSKIRKMIKTKGISIKKVLKESPQTTIHIKLDEKPRSSFFKKEYQNARNILTWN